MPTLTWFQSSSFIAAGSKPVTMRRGGGDRVAAGRHPACKGLAVFTWAWERRDAASEIGSGRRTTGRTVQVGIPLADAAERPRLYDTLCEAAARERWRTASCRPSKG